MSQNLAIILTSCSMIIILSLWGCGQSTKNYNNNSQKTVQVMNNEKVEKTNEEWKKQLTSEQYYVLREKGTERPFTGEFNLHKEKGVYKCVGCGNELFTDEMKFDAHCGWPSFDREIAGGKVLQKEDNTHGMRRVEIVCAKCNGHLGHIFDDGPTNTGQRYCVNSLSLSFEPKNSSIIDTITLGGGCFWCVEAVYQQLKGVKSVASGYSGGKSSKVTYKEVCSGYTGHAEVIQIAYNKTEVSLAQILEVFFTVHDPTTLNRQGGDVGTQYRSVIFYRNDEQRRLSEEIIASLNKEKAYQNPVITEVSPLSLFIRAEDYHQNYYAQNKAEGYCQMVIQPKLEKFEKVFKNIMK
jgi:peptide methionine sulfoxide reductase msrA/msrB